jgi:hypothetical protein
MFIIHGRNRVINLYYNQRNTTHEIAKIEKYQSMIYFYHKEERERERENQNDRSTNIMSYQKLQTPFQREEFSRTG